VDPVSPPTRSTEVRVSDLDVASFLVCEGARLVRVVPTPEPGRLDFVLEAPEETLLRATQDFMAGEALVEPRHYAAARKALQKALRAAR
jgi:hypothetical protein